VTDLVEKYLGAKTSEISAEVKEVLMTKNSPINFV